MKDEFEFINRIKPNKTHQPTLIEGIGDDAALIRPESGYDDILCVDTMVENIHFNRKTMTPYQIGYKALAVNMSDIAAMGGQPKFYLVSIAIPNGWTETELDDIYRGMSELAESYEMDLIGGDTVSTSGPLTISVTAHGRVKQDRKLLRRNAKPGDVLFLTGPVGLSAAGLSILLEEAHSDKPIEELTKAHQLPTPQVKAGLLLSESGYRIALNDVSDGLASEAHEIAEASQVHIVIAEDKLPTIEALSFFDKKNVLDWMLNGGEDFQLIGTVSAEHWISLSNLFEKNGQTIHQIGTVSEGPSKVSLNSKNGLMPIDKKGYNHFT
ncbi:thiamine-phosphate kinase [Pseudalkalibacillus berkeleyi]|uniref:Thiamine-monophosphate kinase n=1 Tax=Pseudalkalibacillus berkeleyi TaxID=1069813 RepID=A0ABS9H3J2_9BACL|nr:thiamine-phosphate kinase [Pseudalkalibacillus berkeleyi]MCF6139519.1 thiamine-phosphate kinase [Pseudalkalibacillus berkeleyi]